MRHCIIPSQLSLTRCYHHTVSAKLGRFGRSLSVKFDRSLSPLRFRQIWRREHADGAAWRVVRHLQELRWRLPHGQQPGEATCSLYHVYRDAEWCTVLGSGYRATMRLVGWCTHFDAMVFVWMNEWMNDAEWVTIGYHGMRLVTWYTQFDVMVLNEGVKWMNG